MCEKRLTVVRLLEVYVNATNNNENKKAITIRKIAFYPAFILLIVCLVFSIIEQDLFFELANAGNNWLLDNLGWSFSFTAFMCLITLGAVYISPLGKVVLGGEDAKPLLSKSNWAMITLCTTMAAGLMFWGTAEPMYHLSSPPAGIEPMTPQAAMFAMETMLLHWSVLPYAVYCLPVVIFGFAFYNMKKPFSVSSQLAPISDKLNIKTDGNDIFTQIIDTIMLFCIGLGIAAVMCTGTLNMSGAVRALFGIEPSPMVWFAILAVATITFVCSSISGLYKGIRFFSNLNIRVYLVLILFLVVMGPTSYIFGGTVEALGGMLADLPERMLMTGTYTEDSWPGSWTVFYAGNWASWAPISACFLARLGRGYSIRDLIKINFGIPVIFNIIWMGVFANIALNFQLTGKIDLVNVLNTQGAEGVGYAILQAFPLGNILIVFFFFISIVSLITAMDSTTSSIAAVSTVGISPENQESPMYMKIIWGVALSLISLIMLTVSGIDGIKMLSNLGGFPAIMMEAISIVCLFIIMGNVRKYDLVSKYIEK